MGSGVGRNNNGVEASCNPCVGKCSACFCIRGQNCTELVIILGQLCVALIDGVLVRIEISFLVNVSNLVIIPILVFNFFIPVFFSIPSFFIPFFVSNRLCVVIVIVRFFAFF